MPSFCRKLKEQERKVKGGGRSEAMIDVIEIGSDTGTDTEGFVPLPHILDFAMSVIVISFAYLLIQISDHLLIRPNED